jgi:hypothetical protein
MLEGILQPKETNYTQENSGNKKFHTNKIKRREIHTTIIGH